MTQYPFAKNIPVSSPKKSLGQHWLNDQLSLQSMVLAANLNQSDDVLEIGPGLGALTKLLVQQALSVTAVEFDTILANNLSRHVPALNLRVVESDILRFDLTTMVPDYKVVANIPYYLTAKLVRVLSESPNQPSAAVLLVQKEVAERLAATPGSLSILGVTAQYYWEISLGQIVKAHLFTPPPKVDSQIVIMTRRSRPLFDDIDSRVFFRVVKAGFGAKRKTLLNSISAGLRLDKSQTTMLLQAAAIDPGLRAQNLSIDAWYSLYSQFKNL